MDELSHTTGNGTNDSAAFRQSGGARVERGMLMVICVLGIIFNTFTMIKKSSRKRGSSATRVPLSLLRVMSGADTVCLSVIMLILTMGTLGWRSERLLVTITCKLTIFIVHASSALSLYCWLVLSLVRYSAVFSPLKHLQLDREPFRALVIMAAMIIAAESWLLFAIEYDEDAGACVNAHDDQLARRIQIAEIVLTYFIPLGAILVCDVKVMYFRHSWIRDKSWTAHTMKTSRHFTKRAHFRALQRALFISLFDLFLNLPNYVFRLFLNVVDVEFLNDFSQSALDIAECVSQMLYFAQFSLNAVYLVCIMYDAPRRKTSAGMSDMRFRVRLESAGRASSSLIGTSSDVV